MLKLVDGIVELYKKVATSLPPDIEAAICVGYESETDDSNAKYSLDIILENIVAFSSDIISFLKLGI